MELQDIFDSIRPGDSFTLSKVTIVGPYPTEDFFRLLHRNLRPSEVVLFADDGWPNEKLGGIHDYFYRKHCSFSSYRVSPKIGTGLVHAKIYLFEWVNEQQNQTKRRLLLGSANASMQGFGQHAETLMSANLSSGQQVNDVLAYFDSLLNKGDCEEIGLDFAGAVTVWLPELKRVAEDTIGQFDAWVRRGTLCHKYERDQRFARLQLTLSKSIPTAEMENIFISDGFGRTTESNVFYRPYLSNTDTSNIENTDELGDSDAMHNWKGQFFTETDYGYWTSEDSFVQNKDYFVSKNADKWQEVINTIRDANDEQKLTWINEFIASVKNIFENAKSQGLYVNDYFETINGDLNTDHYKKQASNKIQKDFEIADKDYVFRDRYIAGSSFLNMPQMGNEFNDFAISLCDSLLNKNRKGGRNKLARVFGDEVFPKIEDDKTGKTVLEWLSSTLSDSFTRHLRPSGV